MPGDFVETQRQKVQSYLLSMSNESTWVIWMAKAMLAADLGWIV